jgi:hypothetical protein
LEAINLIRIEDIAKIPDIMSTHILKNITNDSIIITKDCTSISLPYNGILQIGFGFTNKIPENILGKSVTLHQSEIDYKMIVIAVCEKYHFILV